MPEIFFRKLAEFEFDNWLQASIRNYAASNVRSGRWNEEGAQAKSAEACHNLLPAGVSTPDHHILSVLADEEAIGTLWLWVNSKSSPKKAYIYDIALHPEFRGKGLGKATMLAAESLAVQWGAEAMGLHVFAYNENAHALYRKLGYQYVSHSMEKTLEPNGF